MTRHVGLIAGTLLALVGIAALWFGGIPYTSQETVLDVGPLEATAETRREIEIPPLVAGVFLAGGVGLVVWSLRGRTGRQG